MSQQPAPDRAILWPRIDQPGHEIAIRAAWLSLPSLALEPLEPEYRRTGPAAYRYESAGGCLVRDLDVDDTGFVVEYPGIWSEERLV